MPAKQQVTLRYPVEIVEEVLRSFSSELPQQLSRRGFTNDEIDIACADSNVSLSWLTDQEINSILDVECKEKQLDVLAHRIRFSLFPKCRVNSRVPAYILLEPTSICNLRCPMCFQTDTSFTTKEFMGKIDLDFYKDITTKAHNEGIGAITLASRGEPTLHPQLETMVRHLDDKFIEKKINTNATRLTDTLNRAILESGFNHIVFSCDSHLKEEFELLRKGAVFEDVFNNIKRFWELRTSSEFTNHKIRVSISGVKTLESQDAAAFSNFWDSYCDDAYLNDAEERWDTYFNNCHPEITTSCVYPWERLYVWHDGTINPCDVDYKSMLSPGNISQFESISEAWNSLHNLRVAHKSGNRSSYLPCDRCGVFHLND